MTPEQTEMRIERRAICESDNVPELEIQRIFMAYPEYYGVLKSDEIEGELF